MEAQDLTFRREPAVDGIHNDIQFNEYRDNGERWVTVGQLLFGTLAAFALVALYVGFAWLEG